MDVTNNKARTITTFYEFCLYSSINRALYSKSLFDNAYYDYIASFSESEINDFNNFIINKDFDPKRYYNGKNIAKDYFIDMKNIWFEIKEESIIKAVVAWTNRSNNPIFELVYRIGDKFYSQPYHFISELDLVETKKNLNSNLIPIVFKTKADCIKYNKVKNGYNR